MIGFFIYLVIFSLLRNIIIGDFFTYKLEQIIPLNYQFILIIPIFSLLFSLPIYFYKHLMKIFWMNAVMVTSSTFVVQLLTADKTYGNNFWIYHKGSYLISTVPLHTGLLYVFMIPALLIIRIGLKQKESASNRKMAIAFALLLFFGTFISFHLTYSG